ncbi:MAG: carboxymuconolactone decarboxylase family protein [Anaerolineaceae bacterium]
MTTNYIEVRKHYLEQLGQMGKELPGPMSGFGRLHAEVVKNDALDQKTKELMSLAVAIAVHCDGCIACHVHDAIEAGATRAELMDTIGVALLMGGGPGTVYSTHAMDAIDQFMAEKAKVISSN